MTIASHQRRQRRNQGLLAGVEHKLRLSGSAFFRHTRQMLVPQRPGIYLLHDLRGVLYVGSTRNLYRRFHQHYWLTANDLIARAMRQPFGDLTFSWLLISDDIQRNGARTRAYRLASASLQSCNPHQQL